MQKEEVEGSHWSEIIAKKVSEVKKQPFVVAAGVTPSGPVHPGTLCEFLFAYAVSQQLKKYGKTSYVFISDDLDALDAVPDPLKEYADVIAEDMGMPLTIARDPKGCHRSFADHFIAETQEIMKTFGVKLEFLRASELYAKGMYDEYAKIICERKDEVKAIVRLTSNRKDMPADWFPIMPLCEKCNHIDKPVNTVLEYAKGWYRYRCSKCGFIGSDRIENHHYKLLFRLDWATRQKFLHVAVEGGSVDHHSPGGTLATVVAIHKQIYNEEPPYFYKFGLLKYHGKKYSKSKGIGHTVNELLTLAPPAVIKYLLFKPDVDEDKELAIDQESLFNIMDDFKKASQLNKDDKGLTRSDRKKAIAFELCEAQYTWKAELGDIVLYYNIYGEWEKVKELSSDADGVEKLRPYIERWIARGLVPDKYMFTVNMKKAENPLVRKYVERLKEGMGAEDIHNLVFEVAKENGTAAKDLFRELYLCIINKEMGPRLGKLIHTIGVGKVKAALLG